MLYSSSLVLLLCCYHSSPLPKAPCPQGDTQPATGPISPKSCHPTIVPATAQVPLVQSPYFGGYLIWLKVGSEDDHPLKARVKWWSVSWYQTLLSNMALRGSSGKPDVYELVPVATICKLWIQFI